MELGTELLIFLADLRELLGDCVQLGGGGYYAEDGATEEGDNGAFAGCDGLEGRGREVLHQVRVELVAVPSCRVDFCQEGEWGRGVLEGDSAAGSWRRAVLAGEMVAAKAGLPGRISSTSIRRHRDGGSRWVMSRKQSQVCVLVECRGVVAKSASLNPNPMPFFIFSFFYLICFVLNNYWYQRLRAVLAMVRKKAHPHRSTSRQGKSYQPKSVGYESNRTPAAQNGEANSE